MSETKEKILDAAERLFAEQGVAATSLRQIVAEAGVNLASVHYHFGSKDEMLNALVSRKVGPVNVRRLELLDAYLAEGNLTLEKVFSAFLAPMGDTAGKSPQFVRVMGRVVAEGLLPDIIEKNMHEVQVRFTAALRQALPDLPEDEFTARMHFLVGVIAHSMHTRGEIGFPDRIPYMMRFLVGGFSAPALQKGHGA